MSEKLSNLKYLPFDGDTKVDVLLETAKFATDLLGDNYLDCGEISVEWCAWGADDDLVIRADFADTTDADDDWDIVDTLGIPDGWSIEQVERVLDRSANSIFFKPIDGFSCLRHRWEKPFSRGYVAYCFDCKEKINLPHDVSEVGYNCFISIKMNMEKHNKKYWIRPLVKLNNVFVHPSFDVYSGKFYNPYDSFFNSGVFSFKKKFTISHLTTGAFLAECDSIIDARYWARVIDMIFPSYHSKQIHSIIRKTSLSSVFLPIRREINKNFPYIIFDNSKLDTFVWG